MRPLVLAILCITVFDAVPTSADVTLSSPVQGFCRIGEYTPVEIIHDGASDVLIEADGALPVRCYGGTGSSVVVPLMVISEPTGTVKLHVAEGMQVVSMPWRVLAENEVLIGVIGDISASDVQFLFPDKQLIPVKLDPLRPLPGTRGAWEVLDAIVCDLDSIPGADRHTIRTTLGCGITLAVRSSQAPDDHWPWVQSGKWWVLQYEPFGPPTALLESAYAWMQNWAPRASIHTRVTLVICPLLVVISVLLAVLVRKRFVMFGSVIVAVTALIWFSHVWRHLPTQYEAQSVVACFTEGLIQHDFWHYLVRAGREERVSFPCFLDLRVVPSDKRTRIATRPILTSADQEFPQRPTLEVDAAGEPQRWTVGLERGQQIAFMTRVVDPRIPPSKKEFEPHFTAIDTPVLRLVRDAYMAPGVRTLGQGPPSGPGRDTHPVTGFAEVFLWRDR